MTSSAETKSRKRTLITGNDAVGEGAIRAGCLCYFGYPITPQNELTAYMAARMPQEGRVFVQAESEVAAINMVFGASCVGKRAMTSSSSPGISLKQEGISYLAGAQLPAVIVNVERGGPGLGNIAPSQSDYFQSTKGGGHGDYRIVVLAPSSVQEMHDFTVDAFRIADEYRIPVMILTDGWLGQMMEPIVFHEDPPPAEAPKPWALTGAKGRKARHICSLLLEDGALERHNYMLQDSYRRIAAAETKFREMAVADCRFLVAAWGTCARIATGAVMKAREMGIKAGLFHPVTLWPYPGKQLAELASNVQSVLVVEMNCGQMLEDVQLALNGRVPVRFSGFPGGRVPTESDILDALAAMARRQHAT